MQPEQPQDFDFILNPPEASSKKGLGSGSPAKRLLIVALLGSGIIVVVILVFSLIFSAGKANNDDLIEVQAWQTEFARIIKLGQKDIGDPTLANKTATLELSLGSDNAALSDLLAGRKVEVTKIQLASQKDSSIDDSFEAAKQAGNFDEVFDQTIQDLSKDYYASLRAALSDSKSKKESEILETAQSNIKTIAQK